MIERLEQLHADGRLDLLDFVELYRFAEWSEDDGDYMADWHAHAPEPPTYWRGS